MPKVNDAQLSSFLIGKGNEAVSKTKKKSEKKLNIEHDGEKKVPKRQKSFKNLSNYLSWMQLNLRTPANRKKNTFNLASRWAECVVGDVRQVANLATAQKQNPEKQNYKNEATRSWKKK